MLFADGLTGSATVTPRLKTFLHGVAERVEQKPLLHIRHHMHWAALQRFEHMPLAVISEQSVNGLELLGMKRIKGRKSIV